ncbi:hypothetical protein [Streptomyces sp. NPDC050507]|uniref:hypothetical protein n=1 Tax=Streptomyces sp. NPDC050507 TaxID=3365619 RepID=UPI0037B82070
MTYKGRHGAVEIPSLGLTVDHGDSAEVPDEVGAELVARGDWTKTRTDKKNEVVNA